MVVMLLYLICTNNGEITMDIKQYENMSDFDINEKIALLEGVNFESYPDFSPEPYVFSEDKLRAIDYCNNIADMWPIIFENRLQLKPIGKPSGGAKMSDSWQAKVPNSQIYYSDNNPLRAAAIVFLMMKDAEK